MVAVFEMSVQCRSAPDIGSLQIDPAGSGKKSKSDVKSTPTSVGKKHGSSKSSRSKSPGPVSAPASDMIISLDSTGKQGPVGRASATAVLGSPKPKRNLFDGLKQTLRGKNSEGSNSRHERSRDRDSGSGGSDSLVNSPSAELVSAAGEMSVGVMNSSRHSSDDNLPVSKRVIVRT
jgi:hypothetical protein